MLDGQKKDLSIYIHIPFCVRKCSYCDFLSAPADEGTKNKYVKALISEIKSCRQLAAEYLVKTIFIGGGTPSSLEGQSIAMILDAVRENFDLGREKEAGPEITIEINPGTVTRDKLRVYRKAGINRLSFGLQSADNKELRLLGRIHTFEEFRDNYRAARELGFRNINIDLISALPGQTLNNWLQTLEKAAALEPEHISAYGLIIEEGTPFFDSYGEEEPDEELDRQIYARTKEYLEGAGYYRYEISNYAKQGFVCEHNTVYWTCKEYLGLGLGAASLLGNERFHNEEDLLTYLKYSENYLNTRRDVKKMTEMEQMEEFMFLGLRMTQGVNKKVFAGKFGRSMQEVYGAVLKRSQLEGLIKEKGGNIYLTDKGIDLSNMVMARFLLN